MMVYGKGIFQNFILFQVLAKDSDRVNQRFSEAKERGIRIQNRRVRNVLYVDGSSIMMWIMTMMMAVSMVMITILLNRRVRKTMTFANDDDDDHHGF